MSPPQSRKVQPIRPAATIVIARDAPGGGTIEIFMLRRTQRASFAAGMYVFPGGRVEGDDHLHAYDPWRRGPTPEQQPQLFAVGHEWRGFWIAAIRETFEESGLLLAYDGDGELLAWRDEAHRERFDAYRRRIHAGELELLDVCRSEGLRLACDHIHFFNRWVTPVGRPRRFDTRFFIAEAPPGQTGLHDDAETTDSVWISPRDALARHGEGTFGLMRVTEKQLEALARFDSVARLHAWVTGQRRFEVVRPILPAEQSRDTDPA